MPQRIVSLQPSITSTLARLGVLETVVACTRYCRDVVPGVEDGKRIIVHDSWTASATEILAARPELVIASVPYQMESIAEILKTGVPFLALAPHSLADVYQDIALLARVAGVPQRGEKLVQEMKDEIARVSQAAAAASNAKPRPLVYCEEWGKPLIQSQGWVAELVEACGAEFLGEPGKHTTEESVAAADPEVIIAAWCGAGDRVPLEKIVEVRGWQLTRAARAGRVYCVNDEFLNTPGPSLIDGLKALAAAIYPERFPAAAGLRRIASARNGGVLT